MTITIDIFEGATRLSFITIWRRQNAYEEISRIKSVPFYVYLHSQINVYHVNGLASDKIMKTSYNVRLGPPFKGYHLLLSGIMQYKHSRTSYVKRVKQIQKV